MTCFFCQSPAAHPATGAEYAPGVVACRACVLRFWRWFRDHQWRKRAFYEAATKHVRPK